MNMLIIKNPNIKIKIRFLIFSFILDHIYINNNMINGTPKPKIMYFGIIIIVNLFT